MFIVSVCFITHESRFALGFSSFSFRFVSHLCMQIYACIFYALIFQDGRNPFPVLNSMTDVSRHSLLQPTLHS